MTTENRIQTYIQIAQLKSKGKKHLKIFLQVLFQLRRTRTRSMAFHWHAVLVHDEFGKVPFDQIQQEATLLLLQELPHRMRLFSIHIHLLEQIEFHFTVPHETLDLFAVARLLIRKLVTGERQNAKSCRYKCRGGGRLKMVSNSVAISEAAMSQSHCRLTHL